jgi:hypothetical protein
MAVLLLMHGLEPGLNHPLAHLAHRIVWIFPKNGATEWRAIFENGGKKHTDSHVKKFRR